jgi:hypothetical protein
MFIIFANLDIFDAGLFNSVVVLGILSIEGALDEAKLEIQNIHSYFI